MLFFLNCCSFALFAPLFLNTWQLMEVKKCILLTVMYHYQSKLEMNVEFFFKLKVSLVH